MFKRMILGLVLLAGIPIGTQAAHTLLGCTVTCPTHRGHPCNGVPGHYGRHYCLTYGHSY